MNQASSSHTKNFYNYNGSAYSTDSMRVYSKSPNNTQYTRYQPCIYSTANNIQNLQSLKNQISQLQTVLTQQHRKSSFTKSKIESSISNDRSFYTMIKEQLKQVNNKDAIPNKITKRENYSLINQDTPVDKIEKSSKNVTPQGSAIKNSSILKESTNYAKSEKQQALKSLLFKEEVPNKQLEEQLRQDLQIKLGQIEQNKQETMQKLHQEYKNQKKLIEEEFSLKVQSELQLFERKLRKMMMQQNKDKKIKRLKKSSVLLKDSPTLSSSSEKDMKQSYTLMSGNLNKFKKSERTQLVSSFKKDTSINREKKQKVRFESEQVRFKTENETSHYS